MPHSKSNHSSPSSEDTAPADIPHLLATCCADVTSVSSSNFIRAFRFLPPAKTAALVKVYAFCRIMDDCVDEPTSQTHKQQALDYWHEQTRQMFARQPAHPVMAELRKVIDEYKIPQEYFLGIIHGCAQDIVKTRYQTYPELLDYCYHVASLVGLICMKIFGYVTPNAEKVAIDLGMAFQLTNIMRDLGEDYLKGRVYLAQEDLRQALYTEEDLKNKTENQALKQLLMLYHNRALAYYQTAFEEFEKDEHNKLIAARIMAKTYFKILQKMRRRGFRVLYKRVSLNFFEKAWIMLSFSCKRGERAQGIRLKAHGLQPTANCQRPESDCQPLAVSCQPISSPVPRPSSLVRRSSALIVGGGVAGLYAAVLLDSLGYKVTLVEQKPILGGRAFSFTDKITGATVDNGQHLLMGAYHETLAFLEAIGAKHTMQFAIPSRIPLWSRDHKINQFTLGTWPPPFNLAKAVLGFWGMSLREKCGLVKMSGTIRKYPTQPSPNNQTAREWLKQFSQQETALANFWEIFTLATLNSTIDQAPAENLLQVLSHCFFAGRRDGFLVFPQQGLSDCFAHPAQRYLTLRGHTIITSHSLQEIRISDGKVRELVFENGEVRHADLFVSALPLHSFVKAMPRNFLDSLPRSQGLCQTGHSAIISLNLFFDRPVMTDPLIGLARSDVHWFFNKTQPADRFSHIVGTISAAGSLLTNSKDELLAKALKDLKNIYPQMQKAQLVHALVNKDAFATVLGDATFNQARPAQRWFDNFYVIGDWTQTHLPPTLESAAQSAKNMYDELLPLSQ